MTNASDNFEISGIFDIIISHLEQTQMEECDGRK